MLAEAGKDVLGHTPQHHGGRKPDQRFHEGGSDVVAQVAAEDDDAVLGTGEELLGENRCRLHPRLWGYGLTGCGRSNIEVRCEPVADRIMRRLHRMLD